MAEEEKTCPGKHGLYEFETENSFYSCDDCNESIDKGTTMYGCRRCNYDLCERCMNPELEAFKALIGMFAALANDDDDDDVKHYDDNDNDGENDDDDDDDDVIYCEHEGDMPPNNSSIIRSALQECSAQGKMTLSAINELLGEKGMKALVITSDNPMGFAMRAGYADVKWSQWKSSQHGTYIVFMLEYHDTKDVLRCSDTGSMDLKARNFVQKALSLCQRHDTMNVTAIRDRLREGGMNAVVIKNQQDVSWRSSLESLSYASWESTKHGKFLVICISFRPKHSRDLVCTDRGNMNDELRNMVLSVLRLAVSHKTVGCAEIAQHFLSVVQKKKGGNWGVAVFKDVVGGFAFRGPWTRGNRVLCWSEWKVAAHGTFTIMAQ